MPTVSRGFRKFQGTFFQKIYVEYGVGMISNARSQIWCSMHAVLKTYWACKCCEQRNVVKSNRANNCFLNSWSLRARLLWESVKKSSWDIRKLWTSENPKSPKCRTFQNENLSHPKKGKVLICRKTTLTLFGTVFEQLCPCAKPLHFPLAMLFPPSPQILTQPHCAESNWLLALLQSV